MKHRIFLMIGVIIGIIVVSYLSLIGKKEKGIYGSGIIEINEITIASKISGVINEIRVEEGAKVNKGDTLFIIEHKELLAQKDEANALLLSAQQSLKEVEIRKKNLEKDLERVRNLHQSGDIADKELEEIEAQFEVLRVQEGKARAQIEQARARIRLVDTHLGNACILSPIDGIVLYKYYQPNEFVSVGLPILKIGDLKTAWLKLYLAERELGKVHLGLSAKVIVDAYPEESFNGEVTWISSEAEFTPKNIQTKDERANLVFAIKITIPNYDGKLLPGMTAEARIIEEDNH